MDSDVRPLNFYEVYLPPFSNICPMKKCRITATPCSANPVKMMFTLYQLDVLGKVKVMTVAGAGEFISLEERW